MIKSINKIVQWRKKRKHVDLKDQDFSVELKPILKVSPKIYIRTLFAIIAILLLFLILVRPGMKKNGSIVSIESQPNSTAVYIDNEYKGITPLKIFVQRGKHRFKIDYSGAKENQEEIEIKGRIFGSKIFPKRKKIILKTETEKPLKTAQYALNRFKDLSLYHQFEQGTKPPRILEKAAEKIMVAPNKKLQTEAWKQLLDTSILIANNSILKKDLFAALMIASKNTLAITEKEPTPEQKKQIAITSANKILKYSKKRPGLFFHYFLLFTPTERKAIKQTQSYKNYIIAMTNWLQKKSSKNFGKSTGAKIYRNGFSFKEYQGGYYWIGEKDNSKILDDLKNNRIISNMPTLFYSEKFYLSEKTVTGNEFIRFIKLNPTTELKWKSQKHANRYYNPRNSQNPVTAISWYCANDYLKTKGLRLPSVAELMATKLDPNGNGHSIITANLSSANLNEWANESYSINFFSNNQELPERTVYLIDEEKPQFSSFPSDFCTKVTTFRAAYGKGAKPVGIAFKIEDE